MSFIKECLLNFYGPRHLQIEQIKHEKYVKPNDWKVCQIHVKTYKKPFIISQMLKILRFLRFEFLILHNLMSS